MNKKHLIMGLAASCLLLAGCSSDTPAESVPASSSDEVVTSQTRYKALGSFLKSVSAGNLTLAVSGLAEYKVSYIDKAVIYEETIDSETYTYGYLVHGSDGIFSFDVYDDSVILGGCVGLGEAIDDAIITPSILAAANFTSYYDYSTGPDYVINFDLSSIKQTTYGTYFLNYAAALVGARSYYSYITAMSLTLTPDNTSATLECTLTAGSTVLTAKGVFSDFGTTANKAVSDYIASNTTLEAPTAFSASCQEVINVVFGDNADKVVFPTGLVTASFGESAIYNDEGTAYLGITWTVYGKNLTNEYPTLLVNAGYESNDLYSGQDSYGYTHYGFTYTLTEATDEANATAIVCDTYYDSDTQSYSASFYIANLPNVSVEAGTIAELNEGPIAAINEVSDHDVPTFAESDVVVETYAYEYAGATGYEEYSYYTIIELLIDDEEDAISYVTSYGESVESAGYTDYGYTLADQGGLVYYVPSADGNSFTNCVTIVLGLDDDEVYEGYVQILYYA